MSNISLNLIADMNEYLNEIKDSSFYYNLNFYISLCESLIEPLKDSKDLKITIDEKKLTLIETIDNLNAFLKELAIPLDINTLINDGTIEIQFNPEYNNYQFGGTNNYHHNHKAIFVNNNGLVWDSYILMHEISHYLNQPDKRRCETNDTLTETIAYFYQFLYMDYAKRENMEDENFINEFKKLVISNAYYLINKSLPLFRLFFLFIKVGDISKESYESFYKNSDDYDLALKTLEEEDKKGFDLIYYSWYVLAFMLVPYMLKRYGEDPNYLNVIKKLEQDMNEESILACFQKIGLSDFGLEDQNKLLEAIQDFITETINFEVKRGK